MLFQTDPLILQQQCVSWQQQGKRVVLVPTMGYFHAGHEALMQRGRQEGDILLVSLFVNPTQFGPNEDLAAYPRNQQGDTAIAEKNGVDLLFMPDVAAMYSPNHSTWVEVPALAKGLCGKSRPIHFRGVATVVTKLFSFIRPAVAIFGEKDWQQLAIVRTLVRDLNLPVTIIGVPTYREADGLALSSRNAYLTPVERAAAPHFAAGLRLAQQMASAGETDCAAIERQVQAYWQQHLPAGRCDYLHIIHPETLEEYTSITGPARIAAAMFLGKARLIDNMAL